MSSVYESSEVSSSEHFSVSNVKDKVKSAASKTGSAVVSGAKKAGKAVKAGFNWFAGWMRFIWFAVILMGLFWVYRTFFS